MNVRNVMVEECYACSAPDPAGIEMVETAGPNRGKTFLWCRTCWEHGGTAPTLYPDQFRGQSKIIQVMCSIEQRRRLRVGWYDEPDRSDRLRQEIIHDAIEFLDNHPKRSVLDNVEVRGFDYAINILREAATRIDK